MKQIKGATRLKNNVSSHSREGKQIISEKNSKLIVQHKNKLIMPTVMTGNIIELLVEMNHAHSNWIN